MSIVAEIVCIGTELLLGDIVNTNSQYLANELSQMGISLYRITEIGDNPKRLVSTLKEALDRADLVITTGGLGPTADDISKEAAAELLGLEMDVNEKALKRLYTLFNDDEERVRMNMKQAMFPIEGANILENSVGTAPGAVYEAGDKRIALFPGPPRELKVVFEEFKKYWGEDQNEIIHSRVLRLTGIGESLLANILGDLTEGENPTLATYPQPDEVTIRMTGRGENIENIDKELDILEAKVRERVNEYIYAVGEGSIGSTIVELMKEKNLTISTAESITGGLIAADLINIPGASNIMGPSFITYKDEDKTEILGVPKELLKEHTAVSEEVCIAMLDGLREKTNSDICVATTGYAGPEGENIGKTFVGIFYDGEYYIMEDKFYGGRNRIRRRVVRVALHKIWDLLR